MTKKTLNLLFVFLLSTVFFPTPKALALAEATTHIPANYDWVVNFNLGENSFLSSSYFLSEILNDF